MSQGNKKIASIRIGSEFQATIPPFIPPEDRRIDEEPENAMRLWIPTDVIRDDELARFLFYAKTEHHYNEDQALVVLFLVRYDILRAVREMFSFPAR